MHACLQQNQGKTRYQRHNGANLPAVSFPVALSLRQPMLPTRGRKLATSGEAIGVPEGAAARCGDEQIAGKLPGLPRRDSDGVRQPDKRRGKVAAAGWPRGSAPRANSLGGTSLLR